MKKKSSRVFIVLICLSVFFTTRVVAQNVTGTLRDSKTNEPLIGAIVLVKGSSVGGATDINGKFSFPAPSLPFVLVISNIGYANMEYKVNSLDKPLKIGIKPEDVNL